MNCLAMPFSDDDFLRKSCLVAEIQGIKLLITNIGYSLEVCYGLVAETF